MRARLWVVLVLFIATPLQAQNAEVGFHLGGARITDRPPLTQETTPELGVWLQLWPTERLALSFDWAYLPREDFVDSQSNFMIGERDRNRQYVDITLQFHLLEAGPATFFLEGGGGALWNNRDVINPSGFPGFEEAGKESTRRGVWTLGGGFRWPLIPHLNWIAQLKAHNLGSDEKGGIRFLTGLTLSWK